MAFRFPLITLFLLSLATPQPSKAQTQEIKLLDLIIRNYTFRSYYNNSSSIKTGKLHKINLPTNLSDITVDAIKLRCGSLQRYGAKLQEFNLASGVSIHPCIEQRVILVRQNLGLSNWSSLYFNSYHLSGYQLISPILALQAYNIAKTKNLNNSTIPSEIIIQAGKKPITIDFSSTKLLNYTSVISALCASFYHDGKVILSNQVGDNVCVATRNGHFGLVVESPFIMALKGEESKRMIAIVSAIGGALGAALLSLLLIAMFVNAKKKKAKMDEMERRAYEEEALQVSMVGHVRAVTGSGTRTVPTIEHYEYRNHH